MNNTKLIKISYAVDDDRCDFLFSEFYNKVKQINKDGEFEFLYYSSIYIKNKTFTAQGVLSNEKPLFRKGKKEGSHRLINSFFVQSDATKDNDKLEVMSFETVQNRREMTYFNNEQVKKDYGANPAIH